MATFALIILGLILVSTPGVYLSQNYNNYESYSTSRSYGQQYQFPAMPKIQPIVMPSFPSFPTLTPDEIIKRGGSFQGISVSSSSRSHLGKDGNIIRSGGTTVYTNKDGVVKKYNYDDGENVNIITSSNSFPQFPDIIVPQPNIPPIQVPVFPAPRIPVQPDILSYKPGQNEHFQGSSVVSYSHQSDINGKRSGGGRTTFVTNNNGDVQKKTYKYGDLDKDYSQY